MININVKFVYLMQAKNFIINTKKYNLNKVHTNFYKENGYLILRNIFSKSEMKNLNNSIKKFADKEWHNIMNPDRMEFIIAQSLEKLNSFNKINQRIDFILSAKKTADLWRKFLIEPRIKKILEQLTKKKFNALMSHIIFKRANTKYAKMAWSPHQDNSYSNMKNDSLITLNLFIHSSNKKNGGLYIYPKTHKLGLVRSVKKKSYYAKPSQKPGNEVSVNLNHFEKIDLNNKSGDLYIMNGNLIHGSYPNNSKKLSRHMISFVYGEQNKRFNAGVTAQRKVINFK